MKTKLKIESVRIEHKCDESPDTSYLGEYSDTPSDFAIIRRGEQAGEFVRDVETMPAKGREYRFFNPACGNYKGETPEDIRKYCLQDYHRMESLNNGQWCFIGVIAKAVLIVGDTTQTIRSAGVWGIESDSDDNYLASVANDELAQLREQLELLGLGKRAIDHAFKNVETKCV